MTAPEPGPTGVFARLGGVFSRRSEFTRNVAKLSGGMVARMALVFVTVPIVTRLYAATDFGNLQLLLSIVAVFVSISTLKYDVAVVLPKDRRESEQVAVLCLVVVLGMSGLISLASFLFGERILGWFDAEALLPYVQLIALGVLVGGVLRLWHFILTALSRFGVLARNSIWQVALTQGGYIGMGVWHPSFLGLFGAQMAGSLLAIGLAVRAAPLRFEGARPSVLWALARRYRKFPLVNAPGVFANTLAFELPVFMLARFFDAEVVGYYMLTERLLNQPANLIGQAVARVYLQAAAAARHRGGDELLKLYRTTTYKLLAVSLPFGLGVFFLAPPVVTLLLGDEWQMVGRFMQLLILWKALSLVSSPVISSFSVVNRQEIGVALLIASSIARFVAMWVWSETPSEMLLAQSVFGAGFCILYLVAMEWVLRRDRDATRQAPDGEQAV